MSSASCPVRFETFILSKAVGYGARVILRDILELQEWVGICEIRVLQHLIQLLLGWKILGCYEVKQKEFRRYAVVVTLIELVEVVLAIWLEDGTSFPYDS